MSCLIATVGLAILAYFSGCMLVDFKVNHMGVMNFSDAALIIGGKWFKYLILVLTIINSIFVAASHVNAGSTAFTAMSSNAICSTIFALIMGIIGFIFAVPRKFEQVSYVSFLSCISIVSACFITIIACGSINWENKSWKAFNNPGLETIINSFTEIG